MLKPVFPAIVNAMAVVISIILVLAVLFGTFFGYTKIYQPIQAKNVYDDMRELNFTMAYDNHVLDAGYSSVEERRDAYSAVTPERIAEISDMIFRPENLTLTLKGKATKIDKSRLENIIKDFAK